MDEADEAALVARSLDGDHAAFASLIGAHQRVLYNVALRMLNNREDARDVIQTVFLKAWRKLHTFDRRLKFFSWIYRIMLNETLNLLERRRPHDALDEGLVSEERTPDERCHEREVSAVIQRALMELTPAQRQLIILHHFHHLSHREMGDMLAIPDKTVKSRLYTARQHLGAILQRSGMGPS